MTSNFDSHNSNHQPSSANQSSQSLNTMQRDRFEMLSAYLDGEVTADERRQIEEWLANDSTVQRLHERLLKLRQAFQTIPVPSSNERAVQATVDAVLSRVDRRPRLSLIWGGIAIAAVAVGAVTNALLGENSPLQMARTQDSQEKVQSSVANSNSEPLLVALDKPLVSIPKTPVASPSETNSNPQFPSESNENIR